MPVSEKIKSDRCDLFHHRLPGQAHSMRLVSKSKKKSRFHRGDMILFQDSPQHPHITQILVGDKTETRRQAKRWVMRVGGVYPVHDASKGLFQKREDAVCFIKCTARWEERLGDLTEESACREGL